MNTTTPQVAVVTGGTAGIGRSTVRAFATRGYDVAILARGQAGPDGADADAVGSATDRIETELGPIDVWVNCAFAGVLALFWDPSPQEFRQMTDATYYGQVRGTRAALRVRRARNAGSIVNVSSAVAYRGIPPQSAYCGAKHAIKGQPGRRAGPRSSGWFDAHAHDRDPVSFVARNRAATLGAATATVGALGAGAAALMRRG